MINSRRGKGRGRRAVTPEFKMEALRVMREQRELGATPLNRGESTLGAPESE
jgi:hypothetical protein